MVPGRVSLYRYLRSYGNIRSGGQTKLTLYLDLIGGWLIGIPLGLLTSRVFGWPIEYVYFFICLEEVFRMVVGLIWMRRKVWVKNLVEEEAGVAV